MKKMLAFLFTGILILMLQMCLSDAMGLGAYAPDLMLTSIIYMGIFRNHFRGAIIAFILGYLIDLLSGGVVGLSSIVYLAVFFATRVMGKIFYARSTAFPIIMTLTFSLMQRLLSAAILEGFEVFEASGGIDWGMLSVRSAISAALAPLVFRFLFFIEALSTKGSPKHRMVEHGLR